MAYSQLVLEQCPIDKPMPKVLLTILLRVPWLEKSSGQPLGFRQLAASFEKWYEDSLLQKEQFSCGTKSPFCDFFFLLKQTGLCAFLCKKYLEPFPYPLSHFLAGKKAHELSLSYTRTVMWWVCFRLISSNTSRLICQMSFFHGPNLFC